MSTNRKNLLRNTVAVNVGCSCRRPNFSDVFQPKPKTKTKTSSYQNPDLSLSSSSSWDRVVGQSATSTTFSPNIDPSPQFSEPEYEYDPNSFKTVCGYGRIGESIAVVKHSDDPYLDFRHSMLQMILENDIYSRDDLRQLLDCFLQLNSPYHHEIIVQAFTEIWNGVFSVTVKRV
ncbi:hypothetical protein HHK36_011453 [Tetracentron sinense]|uniref:Transcription repressor n=1 Tax=Tetracentron sinense TaxID=13715 RepID=A0A835DHA7_TETSI|nr:hypothetical protein HHK36_011453 [Tetracentron sinense]